ncbi:MAG: ribonuclease D [Halomonadaceae bacterium]|nr:MAG: ribonuclease D [Halomonadaceae bacterium]
MSTLTPPKAAIPQPEELDPVWLETPQALDDWLAAIPPHGPVALDSEFERSTTFFARPGLVQIACGDQAYLIEPTVAASSQGFRRFLADPDRCKLLYALSEDVELFREWLAVDVKGALDVQLAAALAGEGLSVGFARLVSRLLGIDLDKGLTRSDWLARPLSQPQQQYALADVVYLLPLYQQLHERLAVSAQLEALQEESERFCADLAELGNPETYYLRVRNGWFLSPTQQALLQRLCSWREQRCRELDRPRGRVVADKLLLGIAEKQPRNATALGRLPEMPPVVVRKHGDAILTLVEDTLEHPSAIVDLIAPPLSREEQRSYKQVKELLEKALVDSPVPVELLAPRRKLEAQFRDSLNSGQVPQLLTSGWRSTWLGPVMPQLEDLFSHG